MLSLKLIHMRSICRYSRILGSFNSAKNTGKMNYYREVDNNFRRAYDGYDRMCFTGSQSRRNIYDPYVSNSLLLNPPPPPPIVVNCGELRRKHQGKFVEITGRFGKKRLSRFAELRDRFGVTQLVILEEKYPQLARRFSNMTQDSILTIIGQVVARPVSSRNGSMPTGDVEVEVGDILKYAKIRNTGMKRSYSTMTQSRTNGITSTEYKMAKSENILKYFDNRDITCNDLRRTDVGKVVTLIGWLPSLASSKFKQLKDGYGQTQIIVEGKQLEEILQTVTLNTVLRVTGRVVARPNNNINPKYETGQIEVCVDELKILNPEEPYDGPIKEKISKMAIEETLEEDDDGQAKITAVEKPQRIADTNKFTYRTHNCGELNITNVGDKVTVCGWLEFSRMKKFIVLRDGYGQVQVLIPEELAEKYSVSDISLESIVKIEGTVTPRPSNMQNPAMKSGEIEIQATSIEILNGAKKQLPMEVRDFNRAKEVLRMEHRYIDLRFSDMQRNLRIRSSVLMKMREYLINYLGFVEVETPTLFRRTPGGAQEFVVPTRKTGLFYSLVQSPQQFKQMLMAGAIDRYFQIARCYRDEATRPDRQPEFTQLDIELSFTDRDNIMKLIEETLMYCWPQELEHEQVTLPFPQITYEEAMSKYGTDKPDTRFELTLKDVTEILSKNDKLTEGIEEFGAYAILVKKPNAILPASTKKKFEDIAKGFKCKFTTSKCNKKINEWAEAGMGSLLTKDIAEILGNTLSLEKDDLIFLAYGQKRQAQSLLGRIRLAFVEMLESSNKIPKRKGNQFNFLWVIDFPMFTENEETKTMESTHHPFTAVHPDDASKLKSKEDLTKIRSQAYDLVLNGQEIGGGSIRIHNRDVQLLVLEEILKIEHTHLQHLLDALHSGCPPHGGIALGVDRLMAIICNTNSIRDVIAFPKGLDGKDHLSKAPVPISEEEMNLYSLVIKKKEEESAE